MGLIAACITSAAKAEIRTVDQESSSKDTSLLWLISLDQFLPVTVNLGHGGYRGPSTWFFFASEEEQALRMTNSVVGRKLVGDNCNSRFICSFDNNFLTIE